jgi:uncharacterized cupin superfamily protein
MVSEAKLQPVESGLEPSAPGWFVVNVHDAAWHRHPRLGSSCIFESRPAPFAELGINLRVLEPGQPNGIYHSEPVQEDFLVLAGECVLLVEEEERSLKAWDFVHCPPGTSHIFVGAGSAPCIILMVGRRDQDRRVLYPRSQAALRHGAGVEVETTSPAEAYANEAPRENARPSRWVELPWA